MAPPLDRIGTWDEITAHQKELRGHTLRVTILPDEREDRADSMLQALSDIEERSAAMNPEPDERDFLREGRNGAMCANPSEP